MVNNLDLYLLDHKERLHQSSRNYELPHNRRHFSLRLSALMPALKQLRALLFL